MPNGDTATLSIRFGDDIDELVQRFCAQHRLSEDCAPHIHHYVMSRYGDAVTPAKL